ncbi:MAG: HIT domain-containing protein [Acidobacteria bacterium]|nr:HIT domain-containing protein [Candidatus Sulfomarinibacter sp. MAG AM1]
MVEILFAPWRLEYVSAADTRDRTKCVFCSAFESKDDRATLTLRRDPASFALLNLYPYTTGHAMVAPIRHCSDLADVDVETLSEMMNTVKDLMAAMRELYRPHGFNVGFNVGEAAGAGIEEHLHLHVVPRWNADNNMMTVIGGSRVIPEDLGRTLERMVGALQTIRGNADDV